MPRKRGKITSYEKENRSKLLTQSEYKFLLRLKSVTVTVTAVSSSNDDNKEKKKKKIPESEYPLVYQHSLKHRLLNKMADMKQACKLLRELEPSIRKLP